MYSSPFLLTEKFPEISRGWPHKIEFEPPLDSPTIVLRSFRLTMNGMKLQKAGESVQKQNNTMHKVNEKAK